MLSYIPSRKKPNKKLLDFTVKKGIARGWRVILEEQCILSHIKKHGNQRPELNDKNFIDNEIKETVENPLCVYPNVKMVKGKKEFKPKSVIIFYKAHNNSKWKSKNNTPINYIRVVAMRNKKKVLKIVTAFITSNINQKKICNPIKKI